MSKTIKANIGIIGLGYWGKNILRNLWELKLVKTACDLDPKIIKQRKKEFPKIKYTSDLNEILNDKGIKAVIISTPASTHYKFAKKALSKGKDVFVEKPLALTLEQGEELVNLAGKLKKILFVGHILQYHPAIIKLKKLIEKGKLGKVQYLYSNRLNIGKLRVEENILWSFAPHDISAILELVGSEPRKISCFGESYLNKGVFDLTLTDLEFRNKVRAHIFVSWLHPFKEQKLIVVGSKAMAVFNDLSDEKLLIYPHRIEWKQGKIPIAHKADSYPVAIEKKEPLKEEIKNFADCITKRKKPKTDGQEGVRVLKVLERAEKSLRENYQMKDESKGKNYFVHPTSCIDKKVSIGRQTKIWHFSHILKDSKIGKNCTIGQNVSIGPDVKIGNNVKIQNNVSVYKKVTLEDDVFCGPSCVFTNVNNPRAFIKRKHEFIPTLVKKGASIGANATIICGVTIGRYSFIGAGAVVNKKIPDYALVVGIPAKQIGWVCKCGMALKIIKKDTAICCKSCKSKYRIQKNKLSVIKETF